ncbi:hypothetical protein FCY42_03755 [Escherichia coli]|nr:hypothetical protein AZE29_24495 [Escherichia coli APEC O2]MDN2412767.1 hypothetical protein [Escherichia coli]
MFILPPCEEGTTIQIVRVWSGSPRVDRNIVLGLHPSRPQSKPETGKLQAPAVILPFFSKIAVYLYSESCLGLFTCIIAHASKTKSPAAISDCGRKCKAGALPP